MGADRIEYLGFLITAEGSRPLPEKVEAIINYKLPSTIHDLRTFLGLINFYRSYLKDAAKTQALLHELLKGKKKKERRKVPWTDDTRRNFEKCKTDLAEAALLSFPRTGIPLSLCTDALYFAVDSVLQQFENDGWKPIAFYSKKLNDTQRRKTLWCDISTSKIRPYTPEEFRMQMFRQIHGFCHPGVKSTIKQITEKFICPDMKKQVGEWAKTCMRCEKCKVNRHTKSKFDGRSDVVHMDFIGPLPSSEGMEYCLTSIDRYSSWIEAVPLPAEIVGKAFYNNWICRF
ncbi:retrovirus-related Pol polyprotein from transposon opus [Nephila pilipes]|uniref:RNA-directed DNA polymerase n=1 Tax=Nephila pilipes TaxID=299642 RepID=A0A8X6R083_NEPPI|nr:retrovirus-related Pol polyprotein from transposon opus [Nephila pilipes]